LNRIALGAPQRATSLQHLRRSRAQANRIGLSFEIVHRKGIEIPIRRLPGTGWPDRMRVIVDGLNACDLRGDFRIEAREARLRFCNALACRSRQA
jgi:hypothetical protein